MLTAVAVLASLAIIGWLIYRGVRQKPIRAHTIIRAIAYLTGLYTFAFFLSMNFPLLIKVVVSIVLGAVLIVIGATIQRRYQADRT
ncbi:MAG TPA: hypothetical protein VFF92_04090 [Dehalococcoidales bacterium]|nr:hypothetical protein [Dehalococcoidales bacterium]